MHKIIIFLIGLTAISTVYAVNPFTSFQVATTSLTSNAILQSSDGTFSKWIAPNTSTSPMFLTQASGTAPYWSSLPTTAIQTYYLTGSSTDVAGMYRMVSISSYATSTLFSTSTTLTTSALPMGTFITNTGFPNLQVLPSGNFLCHYDTQKSAGANNYYTYCQIYKRTTGGTETLIATSDNSTQTAVNTVVNTTVNGSFTGTISLNATDRLVMRVYGVMVSSTASVSLQVDDATSARLEIPSPSVDSSTFIPYVGATTNTDLGVFGLTTSGYLNATTSQFTFASSSSLTVTGQTLLATAGGSVGIGTTNPSSLFTVNGGGALFTVNSFAQSTIRNSGSALGSLTVGTGANTVIGLVIKGVASQSSDLQQWQNTSGTILANVTASGNVGIGTSTPSAKLAIQAQIGDTNTFLFTIASSSPGATSTLLSVRNASVFNTLDVTGGVRAIGTASGFYAGNAASGLYWQNSLSSIIGDGATGGTTNYIAFNTNSLERARFDSNGRLGVGTSTPTSLLTVSSSTATGTSKLLSIATSSELFTVLANGRVGIGIGAPLSILHLFGGVGNTQILFTNSTTGSGSGAYIGQLGGNDLFNVNQTSTGKIYFGTGNTTRLTVDNLGNFGVGTTTPTGLLTSASSTIANTGKLFSVSKITELFTILGNGFVGIGTTTPQASLIVATSSIGEIEYDWTTGTSTNMSVDFVGVRKQQRMMISTAAQSITILPMYNGANGRLVVCNPGADSAGATTFYSSTTIKVFTTQTTTAGNCMFWSFNQTAGSSSPIIAVYGNVL